MFAAVNYMPALPAANQLPLDSDDNDCSTSSYTVVNE
jgi:hypothetical protein